MLLQFRLNQNQKWRGTVGCFGQIENIRRQSLVYVLEEFDIYYKGTFMIAMNTQTHQDFKLWAGLKHSGRGPVHSNDNSHYWIEDGSIVTLDVINRTGINVEFSIN